MRYTSKERWEAIERAKRCGLSEPDAIALRRIALTLHRWFELECGTGDGQTKISIERDGENNDSPPYMRIQYPTANGYVDRRWKVADRETGARKRLNKLMSRYPEWRAFVQTDPRCGTIYLCKPEDATDCLYLRGVFIA